MTVSVPSPPDPDRDYLRTRVLAETQAALTCGHPKAAAIHVDLATRYLRMFNVSAEAMKAPPV